jgi:hypothetical protein
LTPLIDGTNLIDTMMRFTNGQISRSGKRQPPKLQRSFKTLFLIVFLELVDLMTFATSFTANIDRNGTTNQKSTKLRGTLSWSGDATASLELDRPKLHSQGLSIRNWLDDPTASNIPLLGTNDVEEREDDIFLCRQPPIDFFGVALQPIFVNRITRKKSGCATVAILDAQTKVQGGSAGNGRTSMAGSAIHSLLQDSTFQGRSTIQAHDHGNKLTVDLSLTLKVNLPPFVLLPPGFNTMGNSIMKRAGKARSQQLLLDLQAEYEYWVSQKLAAASGTQRTARRK